MSFTARPPIESRSTETPGPKIEIRTFEGHMEELSSFIVSQWRRSYEGKMPVPLWDATYLRRQLLPEGDDDSRDLLVAAYDGTKLVGVHPMWYQPVLLRGQRVETTAGSFLTVDPEYRRQRVAAQMQQEQERRHCERGLLADFGFLYLRSAKSLGKKFWLKMPKGTQRMRKMGTWIRALDNKAAWNFELFLFERFGSWWLSHFIPKIRQPGDMTGIRAYRPDDLPQCLKLVDEDARTMDLAYLWDEKSLARQLEYPDLAKTVVLEKDGRIAGLVNYFRLNLKARTEMRAGMIDLIVFGDLAGRDRRRLLMAAMHQMLEEGLKGVSYLRGTWDHWGTLFSQGLFPMLPEYYLAGTRMDLDVPLDLERIGRTMILWR